MAKTYINQNRSKTRVEPLFQVYRTRFRSPRVSAQENLETNLLKLDLTRIESQLDQIDSKILENLTFFSGDIDDVTSETDLDDGLTYSIDGVEFYFEDYDSTNNMEIDVFNKIGSKISRLVDKINRLENG